MSILGYIERDEYFVTTESDLVWTDNQKAGTINLSHNVALVNSLNIDDAVIKDACFLKKAEFAKKYESKRKEGAKMNAEQIFKALRKIIVDDKVPIYKKKTKVAEEKPQPPKPKKEKAPVKKDPPKKTAKPAKKGSRKDQVRALLKSGVTDPKKIADELGTHPSYVWRLIKEING